MRMEMDECPIPEKRHAKIWIACCETCLARGYAYERSKPATWATARMMANIHQVAATKILDVSHDVSVGRKVAADV